MRRRWLCFALCTLVVVPCFGLDVPSLERRVTDLAGLFSASAASSMEAELEGLETETGAQVAVLTIPSLEGQPLEDYALRVVEAWQLGQEKRDNGVLILIVRDDRKIRIEVGYGLEGVLPDAMCGRIIDNAMKPAFRQGDFSAGTLRAVEVIAGLVRGDPDAATLHDESIEANETMGIIVTAIIFFVVVGTFAVSALFSKGGGAWFLYFFLMPFFFAFPGALLGFKWGGVFVLAWLIGFPLLRTLIWHTGAGKTFRTSHPTWITMGSSGGSWGGGGSFGGGGFSGGGGSFGGGGASGGW